MTYPQILQWIKNNLSQSIQQAIAQRSGTVFTEDWLGSIACREVGELIARYAVSKPPMDLATIASLMRGDFTQRPNDKEKIYHGFSFWQIDIASFPDFITSGKWKDPLQACLKAIDILESKRKYLMAHVADLSGEALERATTAAYNCGEGNVTKVLTAEPAQDVDSRTTQKNYSEQVFQFREIYRSLS